MFLHYMIMIRDELPQDTTVGEIIRIDYTKSFIPADKLVVLNRFISNHPRMVFPYEYSLEPEQRIHKPELDMAIIIEYLKKRLNKYKPTGPTGSAILQQIKILEEHTEDEAIFVLGRAFDDWDKYKNMLKDYNMDIRKWEDYMKKLKEAEEYNMTAKMTLNEFYEKYAF